MAAVVDSQLHRDAPNRVLDRAVAELQLLRNHMGPLPLQNEIENLAFARLEVIQSARNPLWHSAAERVAMSPHG
jgi:hypothetical protein